MDPAERLRAEVEPLLEAIAEVQKRADEVRAQAERRASAMMDEASAEAERVRHEAEGRAPSERARSAQEKREEVDRRIASILADGRERAAGIEETSRERRQALLAQVEECVLKGFGTVS